MPMTHQPQGVTRKPLGSERPARAHRIDASGKFVGITVRLGEGQEKWLAISSDGVPAGETKTHNEALFLLVPDAQAKPRKTSVYLDGPTAAAVRKSGLPLAELIRKGLASG
jgi:hypothetical protein